MNINILLEKETNDLLNFTIRNKVSLWQLVRYNIFLEKMKENEKLLEAHSQKRKKSIIDYLTYIWLTTKKNPLLFSKPSYILVFGPSIVNFITKEKKYFNRIYDYYNFLFEKETTMLEDSYGYKYFYPRAFKNVYYRDYIKIMTVLKSKILINKIDSKDLKIIESFLKYIKQHFELNDNYIGKVKNKIIKTMKKLPYYEYYYKKLINKIKPKIVFLNTASYGGENFLIRLLKDERVVVGEFQHGVITKSHIAYNYGEAVFKNKEYQKYLPDYLLTYGDFWNENMRIPVKKITVGNPHFWYNYDKINNFKEELNKKKKRILIVSQGTLTNIYVKIAKELSKKISNDYEIIFKLHPGEVAFEERYKDLKSYDNIIIKKDGDIYELINISDYIVSIYSTTIFEAASLNKPVYVYKHPMSDAYIPEDIGERFRDTNELYEKIIENIKSKNEYNINYFWNKNWKNNYIQFIETYIR
ncbi:CDP-Glycerol:Poly(glycerophosphate) glycerophosphotransferase [Marinitoga hydrogenitolerans DSM 16785]|uniref:CDP-Glycerol:Poly(Glycerophosphate) glycerophosphotransferase n=1 Tax=Marinitoga hydrogenitolerans (strain DSM 16785 / JCM 12826 / AT1271) TaxID=1122195 RepID=A0A1M4Y410_MARH1|nr:CDP-glycerol glycerophosphotransferase family protein [Marinitoga hydrogenitolerans]SHF00429.1 CDP-Glycerol:Poly(glycerophosphate) glycerophosphotransferase [Marinitoga hydrogenitolerans DSM 16785]